MTDFLVGPAAALGGRYDAVAGDPAPRHGLRQLSYISQETLATWPSRLPTNRGNGYLPPGGLNGFTSAKNGIFPNFDCKNTDYEQGAPASSQDTDEEEIVNGESVAGLNDGDPPSTGYAPCYVQDQFPNSQLGNFGDERFPQLFQDP